jgi:hypothetical protein
VSIQLQGKLTSAAPVKDLSNYRIEATFDQRADTPSKEPVFAPGRSETVANDGGAFRLELPAPEDRRGPISLTAFGRDGLEAGAVTIDADGPFTDVELPIAPPGEPTVVDRAEDFTLGANLTYIGRVIDPQGRGIAANLLVVIWATQPGQQANAASPISVTRTSSDGHISGPWPSQVLGAAFAIVNGGDPIAIGLEDRRLPRRFIIVAPDVGEGHGDDCDCGVSPPRAPDQEELGANPATFSADKKRCVDFTIPNRTVEEVAYQAVVRTTQPLLKAATPKDRPDIPRSLLDRLMALASIRPAVIDPIKVASRDAIGRSAPTEVATLRAEPTSFRSAVSTPHIAGDDDSVAEVISAARAFVPGIDLDGQLVTRESAELAAGRILEERAVAESPLRLETSVIAELAREQTELTPLKLVKAEHASIVRSFRDTVRLIANPTTGRFSLDDTHQIDWDSIPDAYQATTIAHGHLLTLKQVWRADGYSLGDLLYSLPLAPGQQKLISVLDWDRREVATRRARRLETEDLQADLAHDRDVSDIIRSSLTERMNASSHADTESVAGGFGGFIGPVIFGAAGGVASAGSTASQTSARGVTGRALNRVRDRTLQSASAVRSQRSSVVQASRQGESVQAQTEVVANYNHCHALTVEYFEVLRHLQVSQELAHVQECLFIPFAMSPFTTAKTLRWREPLQRATRRRSLRRAYDALERVSNNWEDADYPTGRYADEVLVHLDAELRMRMRLSRPADDDNDDFVSSAWDPFEDLLWDTPQNIWERYMGVALPEDRDYIWDTRIAPGVAQRIVETISLELIEDGGATNPVGVDATLVSRFGQDRSLLVGLRAQPPLPSRTRASIDRVRFTLGPAVPIGVEVILESGTVNYRTDHFAGPLFRNRRILNDLTTVDPAEVATPLSRREKRNPRSTDQRRAERLLQHLNEHVEYYHRAIWLRMHPDRRYMLLDGFIAPNARGRSVASVVENRVVGIVGNSLVMPVVPGIQMDSTYQFADATPEDLRHLYAGDSAPPMRISVPTSGVFAEAVLGKCNSCEEIDDTRFWRWEEAPIPDQPPGIATTSLASRRTAPPSLAPDAFPDPLVRFQTVPSAPDPTGLAAAIKALGTADIFKNLTGLALNQQNAAAALKASLSAAQGFASNAGALAQQQFLNRELDRSLDHIKDARDKKLITDEDAKGLTESALRGAIGEKRPEAKSPTTSDSVKRVMKRVGDSDSGTMRVVQQAGTVEVKKGAAAVKDKLDASIDPELIPIKQITNMVCWAAGGAMMESWRRQQSLTVETVLDDLGGDWRGKFDRNEGLTLVELRAFLAALELVEEGAQSYTPEGLARLLAEAGPLFAVGDDSIENNRIVHVRIITAVKGDGTPEGTTVTLADSATGTMITERFSSFAARHESTDSVRFGVGVFHF